jgi:hypothetical protein
MLVTFSRYQGIIRKEFVPPGQAVNKKCYVEILSPLVHRVRPQFQERGSWFLLYIKVRPHTAVSTTQFFGKIRDSRIKLRPTFSLFVPSRLFPIPQNEIHCETQII